MVIAVISTVAGVSQAKAIAATPGIYAPFLDTANMESESAHVKGSADFASSRSSPRCQR